jgi:hypothetical protein
VSAVTEQYPDFLQAAEQRRREDGARSAVVSYLRSLDVDESTADGAWIAVRFALTRYADRVSAAARAGRTKDNIEAIKRAADLLIKEICKSDAAWDHLAAEMTRDVHRSQFEAEVCHVRESARAALGKLKRNGRPTSAKTELVDELAVIWRRATGKTPGESGVGTFDAPRSQFGKFVVRAVPAVAGDFKDGFAELIVRAARRYKERNPPRVSEASPKI